MSIMREVAGRIGSGSKNTVKNIRSRNDGQLVLLVLKMKLHETSTTKRKWIAKKAH